MHKSVDHWKEVSAEAATAGSVVQATNVLQMALDDIQTLGSLLDDLADYFDNLADADMDQDGYVPNEEMRKLVEIREALSGAGY